MTIASGHQDTFETRNTRTNRGAWEVADGSMRHRETADTRETIVLEWSSLDFMCPSAIFGEFELLAGDGTH